MVRAREAGAIVRDEQLQGKGNVVGRMFSDVSADVYLMADGDGTYDPKIAPNLITMITVDALDMVVGVRLLDESEEAFRPGHRAGNKTLTKFVGWLFGHRFSDILSGYRALSRRFVKSFPALASEFEIETELTIHALELKMPVGEVEVTYAARPRGHAANSAPGAMVFGYSQPSFSCSRRCGRPASSAPSLRFWPLCRWCSAIR